MNQLFIHHAGVIPKSVTFSAQSPPQTELSNRGLQSDGSNTQTRTYEVMEAALPDFIEQQLKAGSVEDLTQVSISANNSGEGSVYNVTVTISTLSYIASAPYYYQADDYLFKHKKDDDEEDVIYWPSAIVLPK